MSLESGDENGVFIANTDAHDAADADILGDPITQRYSAHDTGSAILVSLAVNPSDSPTDSRKVDSDFFTIGPKSPLVIANHIKKPLSPECRR